MKLTFLVNDNGTKRRIDSSAPVIKIGTSPRAGLQFNDERISRLHAVIEQTDRLRIIDLGSTSGTRLNQNPDRIHMADVELLDVVYLGDRSSFQTWLTEDLDQPLTRKPPGVMTLDELRAEILKLSVTETFRINTAFSDAVKQRFHACSQELIRRNELARSEEVEHHPFRPLFVEPPPTPPKKRPPIPGEVAWEVTRLQQQLSVMTKDRDGWQIEAERLADVVADRDREIEALKDALQQAKEGWKYR